MPAYEMLKVQRYQPRRMFGGDAYRCGLARPAAELDAMAALLHYNEHLNVWVEDATLYLGIYGDENEGFVRSHVEAARRAVTEAIDRLAGLAAAPDPLPEPVPVPGEEPLHVTRERYGRAVSVGYRGLDYAIPRELGLPLALVSPETEGRWFVHVVSEGHGASDIKIRIAMGIMSIHARREIRPEPSHDTFSLPSDGMTRTRVSTLANAALATAAEAIERHAALVEELPVRGDPSRFTEDDNDARDVVMEELARGARLIQEGKDEGRRFTLDGIEVPLHVFGRLYQAGWLSLDDAGPGKAYRLSPRRSPTARDLAPRDRSVSFESFSEKCRFRRYDCHNECANRDKADQERCGAHGCPLTTPVYADEIGQYHEDAFFAWSDDRDVPVVADHPGTERSYAWKASGPRRVQALVRVAMDAYANFDAGYVCSPGDEAAAKEAIRSGYLVRTGPPGGLLFVALSERLKADVDASRRPQG